MVLLQIISYVANGTIVRKMRTYKSGSNGAKSWRLARLPKLAFMSR